MAEERPSQSAHKELTERQRKVVQQWQAFANTHGREAYNDLIMYIDDLREMYRQYAENRSMPHPSDPTKSIPLDNETVASLLQNSRGLSIVKTYLTSRVDAQVVQTKSNK